MSDWRVVGSLTDFPADGDLRGRCLPISEVEEARVAIGNRDGVLFAVEDKCPHRGAAFSQLGRIGPEGRLLCTWHYWAFDPMTGQHCDVNDICLKRFPVRITEGSVEINLEGFMSAHVNTFVWFELNTTDQEAAEAFYSTLLGWSVGDKSDDYWHLKNGDFGFGGLTKARGGAPAHWLNYIDADDTEATAARLAGLGAKTIMPAMKLPDVGTIAVLADPSGAVFALYQSARDDKDWAPRHDQIGDIGWMEVTVDDVEQGKTFYTEAFGWTVTEPSGEPPYYMLNHKEKPFSGLMKRPDEAPVCTWMFYVNVTDVDGTSAQAKSLGGQVLYANSIPDMVKFAVLSDPQGAVFGIAQSLKK